MEDKQDKIDEINQEIDKYNAQAKRVRNVSPLIEDNPVNFAVGLGSILLFISTFMYAYFKSIHKVNKLKTQLNQLEK